MFFLSKPSLRTIDDISVDHLTRVFNTSFGDYHVPFVLTNEQLQKKLISDNIKAAISPIAMHRRNAVGFMLHGIRKSNESIRVYNGGTGIVPSHRGKGYLQLMLDSVMPKIQKLKAATIQLEVLENNKSAIRSYEHLGFESMRKVVCYKGILHIKVFQPLPNIRVSYSQPDPDAIIEAQFFDFKPTWQNEVRSALNKHSSWICLYSETDNQLLAFAAYSDLKIDTFAVRISARNKAIGSFLFSILEKRLRGKEIRVLNVDNADLHTQMFLKNIGLKQFIAQFEMVKTL